MKFKVGDKVRIREDLVGGECYGEDELYFAPEMEEFRGKVFTVAYRKGNRFVLKDAGFWEFNEDMLENVAEKIIIYCEDNKTIAKYYKGDKVVTAVAKCAPEDEFDFGYGAKLAMNRAIEDKKKAYSLVKCVGYRQNREFYFTVGKEYKVYDNGSIVSDNGYNYRSNNFIDSKEAALKYLSKWYIFEEV